MSFQAYLTNIQSKTGKTPTDFRTLAEKKGFTKRGQLAPGVKAGEIVKWLKEDFALGHGHAMAIWAVFKSEGWVAGTKKAAKPPTTKARRK